MVNFRVHVTEKCNFTVECTKFSNRLKYKTFCSKQYTDQDMEKLMFIYSTLLLIIFVREKTEYYL